MPGIVHTCGLRVCKVQIEDMFGTIRHLSVHKNPSLPNPDRRQHDHDYPTTVAALRGSCSLLELILRWRRPAVHYVRPLCLSSLLSSCL